MPQAKPKLFVGSSSEGLAIARSIQSHLQGVAEVTVWKDGVFRNNDGNLEALLRALNYFDFAVFALTADDTTFSRGETSPSPRDNALFEFGLFLGKLGRERCFAVASDNHSLKLPSDLHGVTVGRFESARSDNNWNAATSTPCSMIADEVCKIGPRTNSGPHQQKTTETLKATGGVKTPTRQSVLEMMGLLDDDSVIVERFTGSTTDWFHHQRFVQAFPGIRGTVEITNPAEAVDRLGVLLMNPLRWIWQEDEYSAFGSKPVWWWRGSSSMPIESFARVNNGEILLDEMELPIRRIAAVNAGSYWQSFVYVETNAKPPVGVYERTPEEISRRKMEFGYAYEEYGLFQGRPVTRDEYDDGAAMIDGKPQRILGVQLRARYLTPYNLVIAPHESPINNHKFDERFEELMNGILDGKSSVDDLAKEISQLPKKEIFHRG